MTATSTSLEQRLSILLSHISPLYEGHYITSNHTASKLVVDESPPSSHAGTTAKLHSSALLSASTNTTKNEIANVIGVGDDNATALSTSSDESDDNSTESRLNELSDRVPARETTFDVPQMSEWLRGTIASPEFVDEYLKILQTPLMQRDFLNLTKEQSRKLLTKQLKLLLQSGYFKITDQKLDPTRLLTAWSMFGWQNFALQVKLVVHLYLYGGAVYNLGTERHMKMIPEIENFNSPGAFCMTELEHGSNVRKLQTTAVYDRKTEEFIINTPNEGALKWWIGNLQQDAVNAAVFARLIMDNKDYGIHAFVVPIRNPKTKKALKGVIIGDCGDKIGLNSIDNGFVGFTNVRIPRVNLLNKYGNVLRDGTYVNEHGSRRFTAMLGELISGRMAIVISTLTYRRIATTIAVRYAFSRKQFGASLHEEQSILSYPSHQLRIMPILASCYVYEFTKRLVMHKYEIVHGKDHVSTEHDLASLHAYVSGFKAIITWDTQGYLQTLRECCGGQGYSSYNRYGEMKNDNDIKTTFEGDNTVLVQQLSSFLLKKYGTIAPVKLGRIKQRLAKLKHNFSSDEFQQLVLEYRMHFYIQSISSYMSKMTKTLGYFTAWQEMGPQTVKLARAAVEYRALRKYTKHVHGQSGSNLKVLKLMQQIFVTDCVIRDAICFVDVINNDTLKHASTTLLDFCKELAPHAMDLVDCFNLPDFVVRAPIGTQHGDYVRETLHETLTRNTENHSFKLTEYPFHDYSEKDEKKYREMYHGWK
uniref:Acyl-coenzyme A oxidase n=1 Tax=Percolomonas cosmopolitus TaxID=63605 RepID=A0A7S1KRF1_9EUKA|mmetsp:Transcript_5709/g.21587  ORF Transcript_5709/g.21587 Transcript_5709/m.21587 type:complete len:759 (+) Transcript_5709:1-2277(+)